MQSEIASGTDSEISLQKTVLPTILSITHAKGHMSYNDKREATRDVHRALANFKDQPSQGRFRKVTLHGNKKGLLLWIDDINGIDNERAKESWIAFANSYAAEGQSVELDAHVVRRKVHEAEKHKRTCEVFGRKFAENTTMACANLSAALMEGPPNKRKRQDVSGLAQALKAAVAYSTEIVKNKKGQTLDRVVEEQDQKAVAMDDVDDEDDEALDS